MKIAFIHNNRAFLPELAAYRSFFLSENIDTCVAQYHKEDESGADVYWYMMGYFPKSFHKSKLIIHEYCSASVPPLRQIKDFLKKRINPRPHFRLFLNQYVRDQLNINDGIPFSFRDMGIEDSFFQRGVEDLKAYDFVYCGNMGVERKLEGLLKVFDNGDLKNRSVLMLGNDECGLSKKFARCSNIYFKSAVPWTEVPEWLSKARYALNFIPDEEPFNAQSSTKFLEYAAMQIPIVSTNYYWISEFQERYGGKYFLLKDDLSNMTWDRISSFQYEFPNLTSWRWELKIRESGILDFLRQPPRFPQLTAGSQY